MGTVKTHYRACSLCEAICGLEIKVESDEIVSIKGDKKDPLSRGFICPKGTAMQDLQNDPNRLRRPVKRVGDDWEEISWEEAFDLVAENVYETQQKFGNDALGIYVGNPSVHNYGSLTHGAPFSRLLKTKNRFSATSLDQLPIQLVAYLMYGHQFLIPVPDINRTDYFLMIGANPIASNGSIWTVPDIGNRIKALKQRGGELVVVDPRRTETAEVSTTHHYIKPSSDAFFLMALIHTLFEEDLIKLGHFSDKVANLDSLKSVSQAFTPESVSELTGISADTIRQIAKKLATSERAVCYGRMGISTQIYGTICNWAIQVINVLCGNLDVEGGVLPTHPAVGYIKPGESGKGNFARAHSRVSGLPSFSGELPVVVMAEEMLTPGEGQIKSFVTMAGNPVLSSPNGAKLDQALEQLDFMVSIDFYINETTRHADVILPPTAPLEHDHYDIAFLRFAMHNTARFNESIFDAGDGALHDWQILNSLSEKIAAKRGEAFQALPEPSILMDFLMQSGFYTENPSEIGALSLEKLKAHPHGIDLGPLRPSMSERLCTEDGFIELAPHEVIKDLERLETALRHESANDKMTSELDLQLIGRRHVRSNNSWMHNSHRLVKGKARWQLLMHPEDMLSRSIKDGDTVQIKSKVNTVSTIVSATEDIMPGVVSLPHGWGHQRNGVRLDVAAEQQGVSANDVTDETFFDELSGNAGLNGVEVEVSHL